MRFPGGLPIRAPGRGPACDNPYLFLARNAVPRNTPLYLYLGLYFFYFVFQNIFPIGASGRGPARDNPYLLLTGDAAQDTRSLFET